MIDKTFFSLSFHFRFILSNFSPRGNEGKGSWDVEARLGTARAYASSILLPNGTLWILGGLGKTKMLKSTELVWMEESGSFMTKPGPDMTQEVFGHCAFLHPSGSKVVNTGGFDGTNRYMKYTEEFHLTENSWETRPWSDMKTGRYKSLLNSFTCV